jgi:hypothetical protein
MDLEAKNCDPQLAESASDAVVGALRDLQVFKVVSRAEIRQMLSLDRERTLLASHCGESSCLAEIGSALGARFLVVGSVIALERSKGPFTVRLQLFDMKKAEVASDESRGELQTPREVVETARTLGAAAVRPILEKEQGFLELAIKEEGAQVSVDGRLIGVSPLAVQKLGWGPHRVVVEKQGFIAWAKDVQVERNQVTAELVTLIPSPDFVEGYQSRNRAMRIGAWTATALAVLGAGAAAYLQLGLVEPTWEKFSPLRDAFDSRQSSRIDAACAEASLQLGDDRATQVASDTGGACYQYAEELSADGSSYVLAARGAAGVSVVAAAAAVYFWAAGEDPHRYDLFVQEKSSGPSAGLMPLPGGGAATFGFEF